ncbi:MAG: BadF/BadG/BcrA/BcrD ATPase family protein [Aestuariivirga sp.]
MITQRTLYIGIDGGGSGSRARLRAENGTLLAEAQGGPANTYQDLRGSLRNLRELVLQTAQKAGVDPAALHAGLGLAGLETSVDPQEITAEALGVATAVARVDAHVACLGAYDGANGGIVIVGTGSIAYGILNGKVSLLGGWGLPVGDQGSGGWLGLEAVKLAAFVIDGMAPSNTLSDLVVLRIGGSKFAASSWTEKATPADYAAFAPEIFALAGKSEVAALDIVRCGAADVSRLVRALESAGHSRICLMGGLSKLYLPFLDEGVARLLRAPVSDALDGAIQLAKSQQERKR